MNHLYNDKMNNSFSGFTISFYGDAWKKSYCAIYYSLIIVTKTS